MRDYPVEPSEEKYRAPEGKKWVCGACGKQSPVRTRVGDASCFVNAILVDNEVEVHLRRIDNGNN